MALAAAALLFVLSVGGALQRGWEQLRLEAGSQRVSIWFTTQALVEVHRFRTALLRYDRGDPQMDPEALSLRYEILLSRLPLLEGAEEAVTRSLQDNVDVVLGLQASLEQIEPDILALQPGDTARLTRVEAAVEEADRLLTQINLALHHERRQAVEQARASSRTLSWFFLASLAGLLLSLVVLILLTLRGARRAAEAEHTLRVLMDALPVGLAAYDTAGRVVLMNRLALRLLGLEREAEAIGRRSSDFAGINDSEAEIARVVATGQSTPPRETVHTGEDGQERTLLISTGPVFGPDGRLSRIVRVGLDVTDQRQADRRIRHLAEHDTLTDLPNRLLFGSRLKTLLGRAEPGRMVAVHCLDLDHFKEVNDSLGHPVGDQLLLAATARMRAAMREGDMLARLGGDEFAVIQPGLAATAEAEALARRLTEVLGRPYRLQGYTLRSGASIGTAVAPQHGMTAEALLSRADIALYRAKAEGRGRAVLFRMEHEAGLRERRRIEAELLVAMEAGQLYLAYQPKFSLASGRVKGCEALLRWQHPERGLISPGVFVPVAEETGLIHPITRLVLELACRQAMAWRAEGLEMPVAVNLSAGHFGAEQGVRLVEEALASTGCDPALLEVEVTEGVFLRSTEAASRSFRALRAMGVRVALDDFGTGYSSLSYLQHLPFDVIKVDRAFIAGLDEPGSTGIGPGRRIVDAIVRLAHGLGAEVVAEGVEKPGQLAVLRELGCDHVQGFLLGRPMPAEALAELAQRAPDAKLACSAA
ncbi:putative bifunctional diguanylate cyclase/phosphodiesterase [Falsiroseomonas selenitidurans]|uniref:EAL domain-containing protein n=1 Tax=Falsiroseomonas selenitidurans TaxID=2716335 RepID=A0ABX1E6Z6_9PROT|nr:bifunctional diguanylate cyclase/phosphodiesterase [Falsiroseomonas selenitidurans]NKC32984.1 EAL domain-containing protein [Falsiroseomonas selenitidurans]